MLRSCLLFLLLGLGLNTAAQDSLTQFEGPSHYYTYGLDELYWRVDSFFVDTILTRKDIYRLQPNQQDQFGKALFSNISAQQQSLVIQPLSRGNFSGFSRSLKYLQYNPDNVPYYNVRSPYTDLYFLTSYAEGQTVGFSHTQNLGPGTNVHAGITRTTSLGRYKNEESRYFDIILNGYHHSKNGRYKIKWWWDWVVTRIQENGGLSEPEKFENNSEADRIVMPIHLSNAYGRNKSMSGGFTQVINLGTWMPDSTTNDSTDIILVETRSRWIQGIKYDKDVMVYGDIITNPSYYPTIYRDSSLGYDSIYKHHYQLDLKYEYDDRARTYSIGWSGHVDIFNLGFGRNSMMGNELSLGIRENGKRSRYYLTYHMFLGGLRDGTHDVLLRTFPAGNRRWQLDLQYLVKSPDLMDLYFDSNFARWLNYFRSEKMARAMLSHRFLGPDARIGMEAMLFGNRIYYADSMAVPRQNSEQDAALRFFISGEIRLKPFYLDNEIAVQFVEGNALRAPLLTSRHNLYYKDRWFKGAMEVHVGALLNYFSSYNAMSYAPWLANFYITDAKEIGNYPYIDLYLKFRVRELELYAVVQHANQGLSGFSYYAAPINPMADRYLRLGLKWNFFN
jgi:hypothetical protein